MHLLELQGVTKRFGGLVAVNELELGVRPGELFSLIGPNGAGKSVAFALVTGHLRCDSGRIRYEGNDITDLPAHERARLGLGRTFQHVRLASNMTVLESILAARYIRQRANLLKIAWPTRLDREERWEALATARQLLEKTGLWARRDAQARSLPYGEQRRLEITRMLALDPRLLLLDEPAAGMNRQEVVDVMALIRQLREEGHTILLIEHNMALIMQISDRVAVLASGRKIAEGSPVEIQRHPDVIAAYLGTEDEHA